MSSASTSATVSCTRNCAHDPAVTAIEGINCRTLTAADLGTAFPEGGFDLIVGDVSFISLTLILPQLPPLLAAAWRPAAARQAAVRSRPGQYRQGRHRPRPCAATAKSRHKLCDFAPKNRA
jgi:hypothetical protein